MRLQPPSPHDDADPDLGERYFGFNADSILLDAFKKQKISDALPGVVVPGDLSCDTVRCPAQFAGYGVAGSVADIAAEYDKVLQQMKTEGTLDRLDDADIITEDQARDAWFRAIAHYKRSAEKGGDRQVGVDEVLHHTPSEDTAHDAYEAGEEIARDIGWLAGDESVPASYGIEDDGSL